MPACQGIVTLLKATGLYQLNQCKRFFIACNQETKLSESERMITLYLLLLIFNANHWIPVDLPHSSKWTGLCIWLFSGVASFWIWENWKSIQHKVTVCQLTSVTTVAQKGQQTGWSCRLAKWHSSVVCPFRQQGGKSSQNL